MSIFRKVFGDDITDLIKGIVKREAKKPVSKKEFADVIIRNSKGQVLLLHRSYQDDFQPGKWCFPGGHVDAEEDPQVGAAREVLEETGLTISCSPIAVKEKDKCTLNYFEAVIDEVAEVNLLLTNDEHRAYEWVNVEDIGDYDLACDMNEYVDEEVLSQLLPIRIEEEKFAERKDPFAELETNWELIKAAFDEEQITEDEYLDAQKKYNALKKSISFSIIADAFDRGEVEEEQYLEALAKSEGVKRVKIEQPDELIKGKETEELGLVKTFGSRQYIKTKEGWKYHGKGTGAKAKEEVGKIEKVNRGSKITAKDGTEGEVIHRDEKHTHINFKDKKGEDQTTKVKNNHIDERVTQGNFKHTAKERKGLKHLSDDQLKANHDDLTKQLEKIKGERKLRKQKTKKPSKLDN